MGTDTEAQHNNVKFQDRGKLYLCPTPIGNLGDITERTLEILHTAEVIAAEDTRNTLKLLNHFGIRSPLTSYHEHNKYDKAEELVSAMLKGKAVACVTDAGTPGISDPGEALVNKAIEAGINVISLPGATAFVTALTVSGLPARRFVFEGFLPKDKKERRSILEGISDEQRTLIFYEAPHHLRDTLTDLKQALGGNRRIALCRELTKLHEEILRMTIEEAGIYYEEKEPKGEFVLVIAGRDDRFDEASWEGLSVNGHIDFYVSQGFDRKEAMKLAAKDRGVTKSELYREALCQDSSN